MHHGRIRKCSPFYPQSPWSEAGTNSRPTFQAGKLLVHKSPHPPYASQRINSPLDLLSLLCKRKKTDVRNLIVTS
ncbi:hypothetical protein TNCV_4588101 [Trichonephila clavipes]|nr:hypothetical protein TNCV_4588101 [Trichonephila clavipes]